MQKHANKPNIQIEIAHAGYYVLELGLDENGAPIDIIKHPVIAWKLDLADPYAFFIPSAILLGGDAENCELLVNAPVQSSCGLVRLGTDHIWDSAAAYLEDKKNGYRAEQKYIQLNLSQA